MVFTGSVEIDPRRDVDAGGLAVSCPIVMMLLCNVMSSCCKRVKPFPDVVVPIT